MGLDGFELILAVEESFEVSISDDEAVKAFNTVGDLYDCVLGKLGDRKSRECLSSFVFYRVRRSLMTVFQIPRSKITPQSKLEDLIPREGRRAHWEKFKESLGWSLPSLQLPYWIEQPRVFILPLLVVSGIVLLIVNHFVMVGIIFITLGILLGVPTQYIAVELPHGCVTVADMVQSILNSHHGQIARSKDRWNEDEVWKALHGIIVEQLGVEPKQVVREARFVKDLGVD